MNQANFPPLSSFHFSIIGLGCPVIQPKIYEVTWRQSLLTAPLSQKTFVMIKSEEAATDSPEVLGERSDIELLQLLSYLLSNKLPLLVGRKESKNVRH